MPLTPFHIAVPVDDLDAARTFYGTILGCPEGRSSAQWIDFDLFGHQIVAQLKPSTNGNKAHHKPVDGHDFPPLPTSASSSPNNQLPRIEPKINEIKSERPRKICQGPNPQLDRDLSVRQTLYYIVLVHLDSSRSEKRFLPVVTKGPVCRTDTKEPLCHLPSCPKPLAQHPSSP